MGDWLLPSSACIPLFGSSSLYLPRFTRLTFGILFRFHGIVTSLVIKEGVTIFCWGFRQVSFSWGVLWFFVSVMWSYQLCEWEPCFLSCGSHCSVGLARNWCFLWGMGDPPTVSVWEYFPLCPFPRKVSWSAPGLQASRLGCLPSGHGMGRGSLPAGQ